MKRGFTLVEVLIVIAVLTILTAIVTSASMTVEKESRTAEAKSETMVIKAALEKYYAKHNEYPSMAQLAGGTGDGRNLTTAQYQNIASLLEVPINVLQGGNYSFMPCWTGSTVCCGPVGVHTCTTPESDNKYIRYYTRTASDVAAGNVARTYNAYSSGCTYTFPAPAFPAESGYSAYFLMYQHETDPDWWTATRVHSSDKGKTTRGDWCVLNKQN